MSWFTDGIPLKRYFLVELIMKKTISLKLTSQEEKLIDSMRKKGISPSAIMHQALLNYMNENDEINKENIYKEVNQVNHFFKEDEKNDNRKEYNEVNQVNQKKYTFNDFLGEKMVYQPVNRVNQSHASFLDQYIYQLQRHLQQLENELHDWKLRYEVEIQYWKNLYDSLLVQFQNNISDSTKRIDNKFDQILFFIEECQKSPPHSIDISNHIENKKDLQKKKWKSQNVRM
jgi:hypothetical protein